MASRWGMMNWIYSGGNSPLIEVFWDGMNDMADYYTSTMYKALHSEDNYLRIQDDTLTGDARFMDLATEANMKNLVEIGTRLLKKRVSRVNLDTGRYEEVEGKPTKEEALADFAKKLSEERKRSLA
ncbi:hypothetical protein DITRI_Ditri16bG0031000 [Diplodiscus trichospermus]